MNISEILNRPYPKPQAGRKSIIIAGVIGLFIGLFLLYFRPFSINGLRVEEEWKPLLIFFYGAISGTVLLLFFHLLPLIFSDRLAKIDWRIKHEVLFLGLLFFIVATLNGIYTNYIQSDSFSWSSYWLMIRYTYGVGLIPVGFWVMWRYNRQLKEYLYEASIPKTGQEGNNALKKIVQITAGDNAKSISIPLGQLLFIEAEGNYIRVVLDTAQGLDKSLHRLSLKQLENELVTHRIIRCHKSFMVNLDKIKTIKGNAQGYKLSIAGYEGTIPVSRSYIPKLKQSLAID